MNVWMGFFNRRLVFDLKWVKTNFCFCWYIRKRQMIILNWKPLKQWELWVLALSAAIVEESCNVPSLVATDLRQAAMCFMLTWSEKNFGLKLALQTEQTSTYVSYYALVNIWYIIQIIYKTKRNEVWTFYLNLIVKKAYGIVLFSMFLHFVESKHAK